MPIPAIAAVAAKAAAAKTAAVAAKAIATKAAAKAAVKTVATKGAVKGAAKTAIKAVPSIKGAVQDKVGLKSLGDSEMTKLSSRVNGAPKAKGLFDVFDKFKSKLGDSSTKEKAYGLLDYAKGSGGQGPSPSEREGNINNLTPNGIPFQDGNTFDEQASLLKRNL